MSNNRATLSQKELSALRRGKHLANKRIPTRLKKSFQSNALRQNGGPLGNTVKVAKQHKQKATEFTPYSSFAGTHSNLKATLSNAKMGPVGSKELKQTKAYLAQTPQVFPLTASNPKVRVAFANPANKIPRAVVVERTKRFFHSFAPIAEILKEKFGIQYTADESRNKQLFESYLPLEAFDNSDFDERTPEEWLKLGYDGKAFKYVPGLSLRTHSDGAKSWDACKVLDHKNYRYKIVFDSGNNAESWVPRINLMFDAEDPRIFAERVGAAYRTRKQAESLLRYNLYIDSMPTDEISPLEKYRIDIINDLSMNLNYLAENKDVLDIRGNISNIENHYFRTMNKIVFDLNLKDPNQQELFQHLNISSLSDKEEVVPKSGLISVPEYDFEGTFAEYRKNTFLAEDQIITALHQVAFDSRSIIKKCRIFSIPILKPLMLDDFDSLQQSQIESVETTLNETWLSQIKDSIVKSLQKVTVSWLNIKEKNRDLYNYGKLKKFMTNVRFKMEDALKDLMEASLLEYTKYIEDKCDFKVEIHSTSNVKLLTNKKKAPLFKDRKSVV